MDFRARRGLIPSALTLLLCAALAACGGGSGGESADAAPEEALDSVASAAPNTHTMLSSSSSEGSWKFCANENANCRFKGTRTVRYGANGKYQTGSYADKVACANWVFGDPAYGSAKHCDVWTGATSPGSSTGSTTGGQTTTTSAPAPTPAPAPAPTPDPAPLYTGPRWNDPATWGGTLPVVGAGSGMGAGAGDVAVWPLVVEPVDDSGEAAPVHTSQCFAEP